MAISTITQPLFRVSLKSELSTYLSIFKEGCPIFCDEDLQWYCKKGGVILTSESGFFGESSMVNNTTQTVISNTTSYFKILGTTVLGAAQNFSAVGNNRLVHNGPVPKTYVIDVITSIQQPNGNNQAMFIAIFKNGVKVNSSERDFSNSSTNQLMPVPTGCVVSLTTNDYIEVFVRNSTGTNNILVKSLTVKIN